MSILHAILLLPLLGVFAILMGISSRVSALAASAANLVLGLFVWQKFDRNLAAGTFDTMGSLPYQLLETPNLSLSFGVDGMSVVMLLLSVIVTLCAVWLSPKPKQIGERHKLYYICVLLISCGATGAFLSTDLFFFYAFHELALIPTFIMIGLMGHGTDRVRIAWKVTIYLGFGSMILLAGLLALLIQVGDSATFSFVELAEHAKAGDIASGTQKWIFITLLIGFGVLISLFPFHSWAAPAYAAAPMPVAMLHAGVLKKFGLYGMMRVAIPLLPNGIDEWTKNLVLVLLLGNIIYIGLVTIAQNRLDRMLGYSSVMHMGYVFLGMIALNSVGTNGAIMLMFAHGIGVALLFGLTGKLREQLPTLDMHQLGGLGKTAPFFCFAFGIAAFASIGLPGFANFSAEVMVFFGGFKGYGGEGFDSLQIATVLALWGVVISSVYMLRGYRRIFLGQTGEVKTLTDPDWGTRIPIAILVIVLLAVGIYPSLLLDLLPGSVESILTTATTK